ncbi:WD40-repeat-containing domain [Trinorchestia longiramus]|nr:WD40-repeat-containing domain [Trinorchestia longiramus]
MNYHCSKDVSILVPHAHYFPPLRTSVPQDCRVLIWTGDNGQFRSKELPTFADVIWHVSWSVTGNILAVSGGDNKVSLWKENTEGQWVCLSDSSKAAEAAASTAPSSDPQQQLRPQAVH